VRGHERAVDGVTRRGGRQRLVFLRLGSDFSNPFGAHLQNAKA
jgi:hypothetical protein